MATGVTQSPTSNTDATQRILVTVAPRPVDACYDEALFRAFAKRWVFTLDNTPVAGPVIYQISPPADKSAIWFPLDSSAGFAAGVPHVWDGATWVPTANQTSISPDSNNAIFFDPSGALKVNLPARLRKEAVCTGPNPTVNVAWTPGEYSLGDEIPIIGWLQVASVSPTTAFTIIETSRSSTGWNGKIIGLATGEVVTLVLDFRQPMTKGD